MVESQEGGRATRDSTGASRCQLRRRPAVSTGSGVLVPGWETQHACFRGRGEQDTGQRGDQSGASAASPALRLSHTAARGQRGCLH